jgi:hypothetical protein
LLVCKANRVEVRIAGYPQAFILNNVISRTLGVVSSGGIEPGFYPVWNLEREAWPVCWFLRKATAWSKVKMLA